MKNIIKEFDKIFSQDKSGEKVEGYLLMKTDIITKLGEMYTIATPDKVKDFILKALDEQEKGLNAHWSSLSAIELNNAAQIDRVRILKQVKEIVNEIENTNEDVWTGHEVKEHILKELDKIK